MNHDELVKALRLPAVQEYFEDEPGVWVVAVGKVNFYDYVALLEFLAAKVRDAE